MAQYQIIPVLFIIFFLPLMVIWSISKTMLHGYLMKNDPEYKKLFEEYEKVRPEYNRLRNKWNYYKPKKLPLFYKIGNFL